MLISEATYAGKIEHFNWNDQLLQLREAIIDILRNQGTVLLPSFAIGRSQELVMELADLSINGQHPTLWIGGMAYEACRRIITTEDGKPLGEKLVRFRHFTTDGKPVDNSVIIARSGMLAPSSASARIAKYLRDRQNSGIFLIKLNITCRLSSVVPVSVGKILEIQKWPMTQVKKLYRNGKNRNTQYWRTG